MSGNHLTRREMKRDEVAEAVGTTVDYFGAHAKTIGYGIAAVVVLALGILVWKLWSSGRQEKAASDLAQAVKVATAPIIPVPNPATPEAEGPKPDDADAPSFADATARREKAKKLFLDLRGKYGSTDAGDIAGLYLGSIAAEEGKLDEARKLWQEFVDDHSGHMLAGNARLNLVELDRREGKGEALVGDLQAMIGDADAPLPQDAVLYELAATFESLKRDAEAKKTYQRIVDEYPRSSYRSVAQQKLAPTGAFAPSPL